jgi:hypothetical protein
MPRIYGPFSIQSDQSGSLGTANDITFFFNSASYNDPTVSGSLAIIKASTLEATPSGARGKLEFILSTTGSDMTGSGVPIMRLFHTGSNNEPRVGIGFESSEKIEKTFEIKSKKDSAEGTELILEGSRTSIGAQVGDSAGKIDFVINSSSFSNRFSSGSIVNINSEVTAINSSGAIGHLLIGASKNSSIAPTPFWRFGYAADPEVPGNFGTVTTGSFNIKRASSIVDEQLTFTHTDNSSIGLQYITSSVSSNSATTLDDFSFLNTSTSTINHNGVIYDYSLWKDGVGGRTGQVMAIMSASVVEMTDVSTPHIGSGTPPSFTAAIEGVSDQSFVLKITNGLGYMFKSFVKKL